MAARKWLRKLFGYKPRVTLSLPGIQKPMSKKERIRRKLRRQAQRAARRNNHI